MRLKLAAAAGAALLSLAAQAQAAPPVYGFLIGATSEPLTEPERLSLLGAPNDFFTGIGSGFVTYDFGPLRLVDGAGQDLNVYEYDNGAVEFGGLDVLVSGDGLTWFNIEASAAAALDLVGDEAHNDPPFRRSYDLGAAVTALGVTGFQYLRLDGTSGGAINGANGFDVDAVAAINYIDTRPPVTGAIPEPATWAMMILGFGMAGATIRRRRSVAA